MSSHFDNLELNIQMGWLLDFYSSLLTDRQSEVLSLYYNEDLSLAEIAEIFGVSRQNIHDIIGRAGNKLIEYERKLNLVERTLQVNDQLNSALKLLESNIDENKRKKIEQIIKQAIQQIEEA